MFKKFIKIVSCSTMILFLAISFAGSNRTAKVQAASISTGGSTIDSATAISVGTYSVGALAEKENHFYSISVKAGQELVVSGTFRVVTENEQYGTNDTIEIYNDTKESLVSKYDTAPALITAAALADSSKSVHTYYIRISDDTWGTESGELKIAINDRFDANSGTDAGADFDTAMAVAAGSYSGYLSKVDIDDYYSISAVAGSISAKITPLKTASPAIKIFDANHKELASEQAGNGGEIITATANISTNQKAYIQITCDINMGCESEASQYSLVIVSGTGGGTGDTGGGTVVPPDTLIDYNALVPITPTDGAARIDSVVRPPLNQVFDSKVKAKEATKATITYIIDRAIKTNDLGSIKAAMEALGYKTKLFSADTLVMRKWLKEIKFEMKTGSNQITVTQRSILSPFWIGIIAGGLILIIIVIIIIAVALKKKKTPTIGQPQTTAPPAPPSQP